MKAINPGVIGEYRRSGEPHTTPLGYIEDGPRVAVAASAGGAPADPDWFRNLVASPSVTVEVRADTRAADAIVVRGPERDRLCDRLAATLPGMTEYAVAAGREIPVVVLTPERTDG